MNCKFTWTPEWEPVFKKNAFKHDSGYNCFSVGYKNKSTKKLHVIGHHSDAIVLVGYLNQKESIMLDVESDGWVRVYGFMSGYYYKWESDEYAVSTATIIKSK